MLVLCLFENSNNKVCYKTRVCSVGGANAARYRSVDMCLDQVGPISWDRGVPTALYKEEISGNLGMLVVNLCMLSVGFELVRKLKQ